MDFIKKNKLEEYFKERISEDDMNKINDNIISYLKDSIEKGKFVIEKSITGRGQYMINILNEDYIDDTLINNGVILDLDRYQMKADIATIAFNHMDNKNAII